MTTSIYLQLITLTIYFIAVAFHFYSFKNKNILFPKLALIILGVSQIVAISTLFFMEIPLSFLLWSFYICVTVCVFGKQVIQRYKYLKNDI